MRYTTEQTRAAFGNLPEPIQDAIASLDTVHAIQNIAKSNQLHIDVAGKLEEEVGYMLLGLTKPTEFGNILKSELGINDDQKNKIVGELNSQIFDALRQYLITNNEPVAKIETPPPVAAANPSYVTKPTVNMPSTVPNEVPNPEADFNMSRDAILSEIENPRPPEVKIDYTPHREVETADPHEYILKRVTDKGFVSKPSTGGGKASLAAEAVMIAEKKAAETPKPAPESDIPNIKKIVITKMPTSADAMTPKAPEINLVTKMPQMPVNTASVLKPEVTPTIASAKVFGINQSPISSSQKMSSMTQVPSAKINIGTNEELKTINPSQTKSSDPYREQI